MDKRKGGDENTDHSHDKRVPEIILFLSSIKKDPGHCGPISPENLASTGLKCPNSFRDAALRLTLRVRLPVEGGKMDFLCCPGDHSSP
ncbi:hypothetical protein EYF80_009122 [Liparis tanakae]|uniref:Uncharacterized protein n=1 Tax=Liparis tanakae TaxID=230148 RepID=A0A4Z2ISX3_9TELE|nr:hypothetical protein EYF80_009122 [Liparis tanakae]